MRKLVGTGGLVVAFALLVVVLWPAAIGAQTPPTIPGGTYTGIGVDTIGGCSEGELTVGEESSLVLNDHGTMIIAWIVTDLMTPLGDFTSLSIPVSIPIDDDGSFSADFDPLNVGLVMVHLEGQFEGDRVTGAFSARGTDELECAGTFSGTGTPPPPRPPSIFSGSIEPAQRNCGNGGISVTVSGDGLSVIGLEIEEFSVHGAATSGSATFAEGTVPIAEDGSFGWTYFPGSEPGQEIAVIGTVRFAAISGAVTVSPSTCGAVSFVSVNPASLGQGGSGPLSDSGIALGWALAAGAFGMASLAIGAAVRRRVR
ncbi:MAG: hypothetical protein IIB23_04715 [Chloroflexi bacterium]|nr:hypothetical protein [Chloroflexota bacterium]